MGSILAPHSRVTVRIESAAEVAARLPTLTGVIAVPYLNGWVSKRYADLSVRIQGAIVRAVTSRDARKSGLAAELKSLIDDAKGGSSRNAPALVEVCKLWCIQRRHDPDALEVLSEAKEAVLDDATVSSILDSSKRFGEMGRSRVIGVLATRLLKLSSALEFPDGVSRVLAMAWELPWEAPAHEDIAKALVALESGLLFEATVQERDRFERSIRGAVGDMVKAYATHPRVAVQQQVARNCDRPELLNGIAVHARSLMDIDPRLSYRLVEALASNPATPVQALRPFARAEVWTHGEDEKKALDALLNRAVSRGAPLDDQVPTSSHDGRADLVS